jgi:hypothetical protein
LGRAGKVAGVAGLAVVVAVVVGVAARAGDPGVAAPGVQASVPSTPTPPAPTPAAESPAPQWTPTDPVQVATKSRFYRTGVVPAVPCKLPAKLVQTRAGMLAYARLMVGCMQRAWHPAVSRTGFSLDVPRVDAYTVGGNPSVAPLCKYRPDGGSDAYYVSENKTICFEWKQFLDNDPAWAVVYFQFVLAHEFGHHVQSAVEILNTFEFAHAGASESVQLQDNRRMELQASCLGAAYLGANKRTLRLTGIRLDAWEYQVKHSGDDNNPKDDRDHGSRKNHGYWTLRAFKSTNPSSCNTFTAPATRVS